uniref:hypothetical protein n=1 Tax=Vaginimicrobium propionicum TaxID=1871034 RepID=UPI0009704A1E|nr:hypothetical protein [Vaginimicrobium propionicum]
MNSTKPLTGNDAVDKALAGIEQISALDIDEQLTKLTFAQNSLDKVLEASLNNQSDTFELDEAR